MNRKLFQYHPVIGYQFIPGLKARVPHEGGGYLVRVNELGFRADREYQPKKSPDRFRVLVFGDSNTAGDGVSNKYRFTEVLEQLIDGIEVYNFGLSGSGTDQQFLMFREFAGDIEHDLVVIAVQVGNIRRVAARYRTYANEDGEAFGVHAKPYFELDSDHKLSLHHVPVPKQPLPLDSVTEEQSRHVDWAGRRGNKLWLRKALNRMAPQVKDIVQRVSRFQPLPEYDDPAHPSWQLLRAILLDWAGALTTPGIVFPVPVYAYTEKTSPADGVRARFRELAADVAARGDVTVHDPLDYLHKFSPKDRREFRFQRDRHPTARGHRALAESLAQAIRAYLDAR